MKINKIGLKKSIHSYFPSRATSSLWKNRRATAHHILCHALAAAAKLESLGSMHFCSMGLPVVPVVPVPVVSLLGAAKGVDRASQGSSTQSESTRSFPSGETGDFTAAFTMQRDGETSGDPNCVVLGVHDLKKHAAAVDPIGSQISIPDVITGGVV